MNDAPEQDTPELENDEALDREFEALLDEFLPENVNRKRGALIDATVVGIVDDSVLVSYGSKEESPIPAREFMDPKGELTVKVGDTIRVVMMGSSDGVAELSYRKAREAAAVKMIEEAHAHGKPVRGVIAEVVRGGVLVDTGIRAFMPGSQVDIFRVGDLTAMVGQEIEALVIDYDPGRNRAVLSRRKLMEQRREKGKQEFFEKVSPGETVKGTVKDVLDFGVFVDLGTVEALIPRSELSYDRSVKPEDVLKPGEVIEAKVLDVTPESGKITLSRKRLNQDPWETAAERYPAGTAVRGKVAGVEQFGAFVELEEGMSGLIHASEISWESSKTEVANHLRVGDDVTCQVLEVDTAKRRISLSLKHLMRDPWMDIEQKYAVGTKHKGTVSSIRDFGAFIKLDEYTEGLLHISDMSWEKRLKHPSEAVSADQEVEVVVLKLDREQRRIGLGIKQLSKSPMEQFIADHPIGSVAKGRVTRLVPFGAFVELAEGLEGLIHISELDEHRVDSPERVVKVDDDVNVKILSVDKKKGRIALSRRAAFREMEKENIRQYQRQEKDREKNAGGSLGDLLSEALKKGKK